MLGLLQKIGHTFYRVWFYLLVALPILLFWPLLLLSCISQNTYPQFYWLARNLWARPILYGMFLWPKIIQHTTLVKTQNYMLLANHTSMIDIMLMLHVSPVPFVFVGKAELQKIPLFGFFYKRVCILVDRDSPASRSAVYRAVQNKLKMGLSICIFPEGGVPDPQVVLDRFKDGAFRMAIRHQIPIVPMTFLDTKKRFSWEFLSGSPGLLRVKMHPLINTRILGVEDTRTVKHQVRQTILSDLST